MKNVSLGYHSKLGTRHRLYMGTAQTGGEGGKSNLIFTMELRLGPGWPLTESMRRGRWGRDLGKPLRPPGLSEGSRMRSSRSMSPALRKTVLTRTLEPVWEGVWSIWGRVVLCQEVARQGWGRWSSDWVVVTVGSHNRVTTIKEGSKDD